MKIERALYDSLTPEVREYVDAIIDKPYVSKIWKSGKNNLCASSFNETFIIAKKMTELCPIDILRTTDTLRCDTSSLVFNEYIKKVEFNPRPKKKVQVNVVFNSDSPFIFSCSFVTSISSNIARLIEDKTTVKFKGDEFTMKAKELFIQDLKSHQFTKKALAKSILNISRKELDNALGLWNGNPPDVTARIVSKFVQFTMAGTTFRYSLQTNQLTSLYEFRKRLEDSRRLEEEIKDFRRFIAKQSDCTFSEFRSATTKLMKFNIKISKTPVSIKIKRPFTIQSASDVLELRRKELEKKKAEEKEIINRLKCSNIYGNYAYEAMIKIVKNNSTHITYNTIIQIMRNLSISSDFKYTYSINDRLFASLTPEYLQQVYSELVKYKIFDEVYVKGQHTDYYRVVLGSNYKYLDAIPKSKSNKRDINIKLQKGNKEHILALIAHPALVCARREECKAYINSLDKKLLKKYIQLKKSTCKDDKQTLYTLKEIEKLMSQ